MKIMTTSERRSRARVPPVLGRPRRLPPGRGRVDAVLEDPRPPSAAGKIYGEIAGYGATCEAFHRVRLDESGIEPARAMTLALEDAGIADAVDYVAVHGTSTVLNDRIETRALHHAFGERARDVPVSSLKSMIGHPRACGAAGVAATLLGMRDEVVHPTINMTHPTRSAHWTSNESRALRVNAAVCNTIVWSKNAARWRCGASTSDRHARSTPAPTRSGWIGRTTAGPIWTPPCATSPGPRPGRTPCAAARARTLAGSRRNARRARRRHGRRRSAAGVGRRRRRGCTVRVAAIDRDPSTASITRVTPPAATPRMRADAFQRRSALRSRDRVLFLHHFRDDVVRLLRELTRVTRRAVVVNDLRRHRIPWAFVGVMGRVTRRHPMFVHDGPLSVLRGFTPAELLAAHEVAGVRRHPPRLALPAGADARARRPTTTATGRGDA